MNDNWVGFSPSPKPTPKAKLETRQISWVSQVPLKEFLPILTTAAGLSLWLGDITKFDFRQGGKLRFEKEGKEFGATYSSIQIPKLIVINAESFGELEFRLRDKKSFAKISLTLKRYILAEEAESWEQAVAKLEQNLRSK